MNRYQVCYHTLTQEPYLRYMYLDRVHGRKKSSIWNGTVPPRSVLLIQSFGLQNLPVADKSAVRNEGDKLTL